MNRGTILAGDVGGTKTVLALFECAGEGMRELGSKLYASAGRASFDDLLDGFVAEAGRPALQAVCIGVAGAVIEGCSRLTNLPWLLAEERLARVAGAPRCKLLNDLEAAAFGMLHFAPQDYASINPDAKPEHRGNIGVIAAGTGLGEAILYWDGKQHHPIATEGGHADYAPHDDGEIDLLRYLREKSGGHVSYERVLSGPGLFNVYRFLRDSGRERESASLAKKLGEGDPSATVAAAALEGKDPLCVSALDFFARIYGSEAGNLALRCFAVGGIFIGGGIAPKILPFLQKSTFMDAFVDKGRFRGFLRALEVRVALNPRAPLLGAARYAQRMTGSTTHLASSPHPV
jgi:glucokinase